MICILQVHERIFAGSIKRGEAEEPTHIKLLAEYSDSKDQTFYSYIFYNTQMVFNKISLLNIHNI